MNSPRHYQLSPLDKTGWIFGLNGEQCIALAMSVTLSGLALDARLNSVEVATPIVIGVAITFMRIKTLTVSQLFGLYFRNVISRTTKAHEWKSITSLTDLPFLQHVELVESPDGFAVTHDTRSHTLSASFSASATSFLLRDFVEQEASLYAWGDALSPLATARSITAVSWHETAGGHAETSLGHQTVVCVSIDLRRLATKRHSSCFEVGLEVLCVETLSLADRLSQAGITVDRPHTISEQRALVSDRITQRSDDRALTLGKLVRPINTARDFSGELRRQHIVTGNRCHRTYWVESWPRTAIQASWMETLLFSEDMQRTISLHMRPVSAVESRRRIDSSATKLETDAAQRERAGFRIGDSHRRAAQTVTNREIELGDGFAEFNYSGFITLSARDEKSLHMHSSKWEQHAASSGIRLVALDGRHDLGLAASLPLGQSPLRRRL